MPGKTERLLLALERLVAIAERLETYITNSPSEPRSPGGLFNAPSTLGGYLFKPPKGAEVLTYWELGARLRPTKRWSNALTTLGGAKLMEGDVDEAYRVSTMIGEADPDGKTWLPIAANKRHYVQMSTMEWVEAMKSR
jgi:hypothetical protein